MEQDDSGKVMYRVGDVSHIVEVDPYVLRYWEKMFPQLKPKKDETGQRVYTDSDVEIVLHIKKLLYEERYTIAGAKKKLSEETNGKYAEISEEMLTNLKNIKNTLREVSAVLEKTI